MKHFSINIVVLIVLSFSISSAQVNWTKNPDPVLTHGPSGAWDSLYIQHSAVVFHGTKYHMFYTAQPADPGHGCIGHATSDDGISWEKDSLNNPVLEKGPTGSWDADYAVIASVLYDGSSFHIWYTGARPTNTMIRIGYASSLDGINWQKYNDPTTTNTLYAESDPVLFPGTSGRWDDLTVEAPFVMAEGDSFVMFYRGMKADDTDGIGRATSTDGITWIKDTGNNPVLRSRSISTWEYNFIRLGSVIFDENKVKYHLFYYAGEFYDHFRIGYAWSSDGINWTKYGNPILPLGTSGSWDDTQVMGPWVIQDTDSTLKMWYTGADNVNTPGIVSGIGYATASVEEAPVADFQYEIKEDTCKFTDMSTGWILNWLWDFGDGSSSTEQNPVHIYENGQYTITLTVSGPFGSDDSTLQINVTDLDEQVDNLPNTYSLSQNYPNPFNPKTVIRCALPVPGHADLSIYNILGQKVATLVNKKQPAGSYEVEWDARGFASGIYLYQLKAGDYIETKKMIYMK